MLMISVMNGTFHGISAVTLNRSRNGRWLLRLRSEMLSSDHQIYLIIINRLSIHQNPSSLDISFSAARKKRLTIFWFCGGPEALATIIENWMVRYHLMAASIGWQYSLADALRTKSSDLPPSSNIISSVYETVKWFKARTLEINARTVRAYVPLTQSHCLCAWRAVFMLPLHRRHSFTASLRVFVPLLNAGRQQIKNKH